MPYELVAGSGVVTVLDGTATRPLWVWCMPQNAGSGIDVKWIDPSGPVEMKSRQMRANTTGTPEDIGPFGWFVPAGVSLTLTNRSEGSAVYVQWTVFYDGPSSVPVLDP